MESGRSVLLTGAAGTGKTYTLNKFIRRAKARGLNVAVTATTGLAATHLNGTTIHAWSGIGVHDELDRRILNKLSKTRIDLINKADILVIDEISMLHDFRLDMVDQILRRAREDERPFGGLQVILCGDFFQLPPVNRRDSRQGSFVTKSEVWQNGDFTVCYLKEQFRQSGDDGYADILNGIRAGFLSGRQLAALKERVGKFVDPWNVMTKLLTTNIDVDAINQQELARIDAETVSFEMVTTGPKKYVESLKSSCLALEQLTLKIGASVMCIRNSPDKKYFNGSLGVVTGFEDLTGWPIVKLLSGREITIKPETWELMDGDKRRASLSQIPLRLAWAITIHKSQGMTLDAAQIALGNAFVEGMGYVALSRVRGLNSLYLDSLGGMALRVSPLAKEIDGELQRRSVAAREDYDSEIRSWKKDYKDVEKLSPAKKPATPWAEKVAKMREQYPNAFRSWTPEDDKKLQKAFDGGASVKDLSDLLGRHDGAIEARLKKFYGEDIEAYLG